MLPMFPTSGRALANQPFAMLRELDRAIGQAMHSDEPSSVGHGTFSVDVYEENDQLTIEAELPGFSKDDVDINVEQGVLTIEATRTETAGRKQVENVGGGEHSHESGDQVQDADASGSQASAKGDGEKKSSGRRRHLSERTKHVTRRFSLPTSYDTNQIDAVLEDGVLTLTLPKREEVKPRSIQVK